CAWSRHGTGRLGPGRRRGIPLGPAEDAQPRQADGMIRTARRYFAADSGAGSVLGPHWRRRAPAARLLLRAQSVAVAPQRMVPAPASAVAQSRRRPAWVSAAPSLRAPVPAWEACLPLGSASVPAPPWRSSF